MRSGSRHGAPSLRRLLAILLVTLGLLVAALIVVTSLQLHGSQSQARAENRRAESFLVADSMRQSSNDLTNMVRLYVATGDRRYRDYYNEILAIRSGTAPRPRNYDASFWDRVLAHGKGFVRYGPPESLVAQMRKAKFTPDEFRALRASLAASNGLAKLELRVMNDPHPDFRLLVNPAYLRQKGVIMDAISHFIGLVENRTRRDVERVRASNHRLFVAQIVILGVIVLVGLAALLVVSRMLVRPLGALVAATRRIASGDYGERTDIHAVAELEHVARAFNEMAEAIEARNRAKSDFVAAMSHEIRTPMIGVTGMLEVLARTELSRSQRHMVATAEASAQSLLQIIGDVLDFSKIEASKLELAPATIDLRGVVYAAAQAFRHPASAKGLLLTDSVDERLAPALVGDPLRLRQILANLLSNAIKFTEVGGVEIAARVVESTDAAQTVELSVTDTGIGVDEDQQARLFSDYAQAEARTAQSHGGTGLGLAICRRLATLMGGELTMESARGRGTTMRLIVPMPIGDPADIDPQSTAVLDRGAAARPQPTREQARREGSLLLIAEDHAVNRTVLRHQLEIIGFEADFAHDGAEALDRYRSERYGLVLTDLNMPVMDGYDLARAIRSHEAQTGAPRVPILALTANVMQGEPERCRAAGMDDFAAKPTTIPFLAAKLRQWLPHLAWPADGAPAPSAADASADAALDLGVLTEVTGGDNELAASLIEDFVTSTRADLAALDDALEADEVQEARRLGHRVKGAARIVGAHAVVAVAQQIEALAGSDDADGAELRALARRLHDALAECESAIGSMA